MDPHIINITMAKSEHQRRNNQHRFEKARLSDNLRRSHRLNDSGFSDSETRNSVDNASTLLKGDHVKPRKTKVKSNGFSGPRQQHLRLKCASHSDLLDSLVLSNHGNGRHNKTGRQPLPTQYARVIDGPIMRLPHSQLTDCSMPYSQSTSALEETPHVQTVNRVMKHRSTELDLLIHHNKITAASTDNKKKHEPSHSKQKNGEPPNKCVADNKHTKEKETTSSKRKELATLKSNALFNRAYTSTPPLKRKTDKGVNFQFNSKEDFSKSYNGDTPLAEVQILKKTPPKKIPHVSSEALDCEFLDSSLRRRLWRENNILPSIESLDTTYESAVGSLKSNESFFTVDSVEDFLSLEALGSMDETFILTKPREGSTEQIPKISSDSLLIPGGISRQVSSPDSDTSSNATSVVRSSSFRHLRETETRTRERSSTECENMSDSQQLVYFGKSPYTPSTGWDFNTIKNKKTICKSLDSVLEPAAPLTPSPIPQPSVNRQQSQIDSRKLPVPSDLRLMSYPSILSEAISPACDPPCGSPNRFFLKLARRLSLKKKHKDHGNISSSAVDIRRRGSSPLPDTERATHKRRSADSVLTHGHISPILRDLERPSHEIENEHLYRGFLKCLLHPLGASDSEVGFRPGDLIDHLKTVFDVDQDDQEYFIRDALQNKPGKVQARIRIIEAKDVRNLDQFQENGSLYCLLTLVQPTRSRSFSPKLSPHGSPKNSPRTSPKLRKSPPRSPSYDTSEVLLRTQNAKVSKDPKWNEAFHLDVEDLLADEIHICVCHQDDSLLSMEAARPPEKNNAVKSFFRSMLWATTDHDKIIPGCIGRASITIRDVPSEGCDKWFHIQPLAYGAKSKPIGQIRLHVTLSNKPSTSQGYIFSAEDYHHASLIVHKHAAATLKDVEGFDFSLPAQSRRILNIFAVANGISKLSQNILDLTVILELTFSKYSACISDSLLHRAMEEVQMTWCAMHVSGDALQRMPLCDAEICLYRTATRRYVQAIVDDIPNLPALFPPCVESIHVIKGTFGIAQHLLELDLWDSHDSPQRDLTNGLVNKLQNDVRLWVESNLDTIHAHSQVKDAVIPEMTSLVEVTKSLINICTPLGVVEQFFSGLGVKYYKIVSLETERKLSAKARELIMGLDKYQVRYHKFPVNLNASCRLSIKLFLAIRTFFQTIKENLAERDLFRLSIPNYQDWFLESVVFWLHMFRTECSSRIQKALEIDKDLVLVTSLVKYSNSSVDVQTCFSEITTEWGQMEIQDADSAVMGVTKITDMICDGARVYASKIQNILERNCYYDKNEGQFDVTDRMCITLNNIEHVRLFLCELPEKLKWDAVTDSLSQKHEDHKIGAKALDTLQRLVKHAHEDILQMSTRILRIVCDKMSVEIQRFMQIFLVKTPEKLSGTDKVLGYLKTNLDVLSQRLSETIYPLMASELWNLVISLFEKDMLSGKQPEYYEHLSRHLRSLTHFFQTGWMKSLPCVNIEHLKHRLELNSWKTEQLILDYYHGLSEQMDTPVQYLGHLALKVAYMEETRGNITIYVKVIQGFDLPGLDTTGLSDPYVVVSLQPEVIFQHKPQRTRTIDQTLQPVFNTTFEFPNIPKELLSQSGMVVLLSVMDRDRVKSDDFAGEVVVALDKVTALGVNDCVDNLPVTMMPLKRPLLDNGEAFQLLEERSAWDKSAKAFIRERRRFLDNQPPPTDNVKDKFMNVFKFVHRTPQENLT